MYAKQLVEYPCVELRDLVQAVYPKVISVDIFPEAVIFYLI